MWWLALSGSIAVVVVDEFMKRLFPFVRWVVDGKLSVFGTLLEYIKTDPCVSCF
jgi:hypothetical protein